MYDLNVNEIQVVSAGCQACPLVPGFCIGLAGLSMFGMYFGWGKVVTYTAAAAVVGLGGYMYYQNAQNDRHDHADLVQDNH